MNLDKLNTVLADIERELLLRQASDEYDEYDDEYDMDEDPEGDVGIKR